MGVLKRCVIVAAIPVIAVGYTVLAVANALGLFVLVPVVPIYYIATGKWIQLEKIHLGHYVETKYGLNSKVQSFLTSA